MSIVERVALAVVGWALFEIVRTLYAWHGAREMRSRRACEVVAAVEVLIGQSLVFTTQHARDAWLIAATGAVVLWVIAVTRAHAFRAHMARLDEEIALLDAAIAMQEAAAERAEGRHDH